MQPRPTLSIAMRKNRRGRLSSCTVCNTWVGTGRGDQLQKETPESPSSADMEDGELRMRELVFAWTGYCSA